MISLNWLGVERNDHIWFDFSKPKQFLSNFKGWDQSLVAYWKKCRYGIEHSNCIRNICGLLLEVGIGKWLDQSTLAQRVIGSKSPSDLSQSLRR